MSTLKTTYIQHPDATGPGIELTAAGTVALPLSDLEDLNNVSGTPTDGQVLSYDTGTSAWSPIDPSGGFDSSATITATNASWPVPASADGIFKVTVVGGGGGGASSVAAGTNGGSSSFATAAGTTTAAGGFTGYGIANGSRVGPNGYSGLQSGNGGMGGMNDPNNRFGQHGSGGQIVVAYYNLDGISTANVTIGAGGSGGTSETAGGDGGNGVVIVEYRAA